MSFTMLSFLCLFNMISVFCNFNLTTIYLWMVRQQSQLYYRIAQVHRGVSERGCAATEWQAQEDTVACASIEKLFTTWCFLTRLTGRKETVYLAEPRNGRTPFPPYFSYNAAKLTSQKTAFRDWCWRKGPKRSPSSSSTSNRSIKRSPLRSRRECIQMHCELVAVFRRFIEIPSMSRMLL